MVTVSSIDSVLVRDVFQAVVAGYVRVILPEGGVVYASSTNIVPTNSMATTATTTAAPAGMPVCLLASCSNNISRSQFGV